MVNVQSRRNFFLMAPLAAAAYAPVSLFSLDALGQAPGGAQAAGDVKRAPFEVFHKQALDGMLAGLQAAPAARDLIAANGIGISMTVSAEAGKIAKEFEMHEHRDHVFQVLDGSTTYQIGGTLKGGRQMKPGEWLAAESEGFSTVTLNKGDFLSILRGTPHKRMTEGKVSLLLISAG